MFFLARLVFHGYKIYNYKVIPLQVSHKENNFGTQPKTYLQWGINNSIIFFTLAGKSKRGMQAFTDNLKGLSKALKSLNCDYMALYLEMIMLYINNPKALRDFDIKSEFSQSLILKNILQDPFDIYKLEL